MLDERALKVAGLLVVELGDLAPALQVLETKTGRESLEMEDRELR